MRLLLRSRRWLLLGALALVSLALGTAMFSGARFTSKSSNSAALGAGSIQLSSSAPNQAIVSVSGMKPGGSSSGTIGIGNQGDLEGDVTLKATGLTGTALAAVLELRIDDTTSGTSKKWSGKLNSFTSLPLEIAAGKTRSYKFTVSWPAGSDEASLQGISTSLSLQWEGEGSL